MGFFINLVLLSVASLVLANPSAKIMKRDSAKPIGGLEKEALHAHNVVRRNHVNTPPLVWDKSLEVDAQNYALVLANTNTFKHAITKEGENLYVGTGSSEKEFSTAAYLWYEEINRYEYHAAWKYNFWGAGSLGHFTQMVWANTKKVGCAGSIIPSGGGYQKTYYVCRYSPPGNIAAQYTSQVKPLKEVSIPTNPEVFALKKTCADLDPGYCSTLQKSMCDLAGFAQFNKVTCPASCSVC